MTCSETRAFLHPFIDGELAAAESSRVRQHLDECAGCKGRFDDERQLLDRVKVALSERCPDSLRAKIRSACSVSPVPLPVPVPVPAVAMPIRRARFPLRAVACVAVAAILFVGVDPFCMLGCPTVRAMTHEFRERASGAMPLPVAGVEEGSKRTDVDVARDLAQISSMVEVPCLCARNVECKGAAKIACCKEGCVVLFADGEKHWIEFVKARAELHPWLVVRARKDGFVVCTQDGCRFVGWNDKDGTLCGFIGEESVPSDKLLLYASDVRANEHR